MGFVSPSHMVPQMVTLIQALHDRDYRPIVVYNSNGYDRVEILRELEDWVDVYLPDFKYSDPALAQTLSGTAEYPEKALAALLEMYRQRGSILHLNDDGLAERGLIVRHLVLPGAVANSLGVLRLLAEHCSPKVTLSLMSQYNPIDAVAAMSPFNRPITEQEYRQVIAVMDELGFTRGWVQDFSSAQYYNPNFNKESPFGA